MAERRISFIIGANIKNFQKGLGSAQKQFQRFGRDMKSIGSTMSRNITLPVIAAGTAVVKAAGDFESSFADIRKTVNATEEEFSSISKELRGIAKTIPTSVNELNRLAGVSGQLGVEVGNIVEFTKTIAMLGDTTDVAGEQAALSLARFMNVMGTAEEDVSRLGSTIVGLGNNFAAMESEIIEIATSMAPLGNSIGLTEQQVLSFSATIAASGGKAQAASTGFQKTANIMQQAVIEGNKNLALFAETAGMSANKFRVAFQKDAAGALQAFLEGLRRVQEEGGSTATVLEKVGLADQRLIREFGKVLGNLDDLDRALNLANEEWERNTALTDEAQERYKTFNSRLSIAYNWIYDLGIVLGNTLIPVVDKFIDITKTAVSILTNMSDSTRRWVVGVSLAAAAIGPLIFVMGTMVTSTAAVFGALKTLTGVLLGVGKVMLPIITTFALVALKIAAVVGIATGLVLVAKSIYDAWDTIGPFFAQLWDVVIGAFTTGVQEIAKIMAKLPNMQAPAAALMASMESIKHQAEERIKARGIITFGETVGAVWEEMKENTSDGVDFIKDMLSSLNDFASGLIPSFDFGGGEDSEGAGGDGMGFKGDLFNKGPKQFHKNIADMKADMKDFRSATEIALDGVNIKWLKFKVAFKEIGGDFKAFLSQELSSAVLSFGEALGRSLAGVDNKWQTTFEKIIMVVLDFVKSLARLAAGIGAVLVFIPGMQGAGVGLLAAATALQAVASGVSAGIQKRASNRESRANAVGMATGGIVPAGFPNDTYPAMLSSGERVIPAPHPLPSGSGRQIIENIVVLDGKTVFRNQKEVKHKVER